MTGPEFRIPDVQQRADAEREEVQDLLFNFASDPEAVFIDDALEKDTAIMSYAEHLARVLGDGISDEAFRVTYRAIHFMSVVTGLLGCNRGMSLESLQSIPDAGFEELQGHIRAIAEAYIERRPSIIGYVDACMPEIDPSGEYQWLAETVAGLIGSQIEDGLRARIVEDAMATWDGTVPEL